MMILRRLGVGFLRLLIGIGFTFSLAVGVTLTLLTFCDGTGNNLTLSRTGPHWEWSIPAVVAFTFTLFCWLGWRCLPATKPTRIFPTLERGLQTPVVVLVCVGCGFLLTAYGAFDMGAKLLLHSAGGSWTRLAFYFLSAVSDGLLIAAAWKQRKKNASQKAYSKFWYPRK